MYEHKYKLLSASIQTQQNKNYTKGEMNGQISLISSSVVFKFGSVLFCQDPPNTVMWMYKTLC